MDALSHRRLLFFFILKPKTSFVSLIHDHFHIFLYYYIMVYIALYSGLYID